MLNLIFKFNVSYILPTRQRSSRKVGKAITNCREKINKTPPDPLKSILTLNFQFLDQTGSLRAAYVEIIRLASFFEN